MAFRPEMAFSTRNGFSAEITITRKFFLAKNNFDKFEVAFWPEMAFWLEMAFGQI